MTDRPAVPSKAKATEFFRLFSGHCDKVDPTFVRRWHKKFDTVARINPVKLSESAFPLSMTEMEEEFRTIAMGLESQPFMLQPTMLAFLKELEPVFKALPVNKISPTCLKRRVRGIS